jgi:nucleoside-diphosphate-sugar epimerase
VSTILVTGGSGFIGSHWILALLVAGHRVCTTVRSLQREGEVRTMLKEGVAKPAIDCRSSPLICKATRLVASRGR